MFQNPPAKGPLSPQQFQHLFSVALVFGKELVLERLGGAEQGAVVMSTMVVEISGIPRPSVWIPDMALPSYPHLYFRPTLALMGDFGLRGVSKRRGGGPPRCGSHRCGSPIAYPAVCVTGEF